ncbi:MAG: hypothetical protein ACOH2M_03285 [Cypionkella sp.]
MISPFLPTHDATTVALDFGVFIAEHARTYRTSQTAIIAALLPIIEPVRHHGDNRPLTPDAVERLLKAIDELPITPSQPVHSSSLGTAADTPAPLAGDETGAEVQSSSLASAPVETIIESAAPATTPVKPTDPQAKHAAEAPISAGEVRGECVSTSPTPSPSPTKTQLVRECHAAHPDWPASEIAKATGIRGDQIHGLARHAGIKLPSASEYKAAQFAATTEALKASASLATQPEPATPPPAIPDAATEPPPPAKRFTLADKIRAHLASHPDATLAEVTEAIGGKMSAVGWAAQKAGIVLRKRNAQERSEASARGRARLPDTLTPPDESSIQPDETVMSAPQAVHQYRPAPLTTARFYVRDGQGRYLHQSLERSPTDTGPLMTTNRKWAWFDNSQRYRGACKKWPEIETMRKEGAAK